MSFRQWKYRRYTASCSTVSFQYEQFVTRTPFSSRRCGRRYVGSSSLTNPAEDVHLPRQPRRSFTVFDVKDTRQFIAAISGHEYEALFALAITTGMRPSEYLALTWSDLDLERGTVSVSKTLVWRERRWYFEDTKRERGRRMIKLQNWVLALLRRSSEKASSTGLKPRDLVFTSNHGGPIHEAKLVWRHFKPLLVSAGLPNIRLYDLRLTAATLDRDFRYQGVNAGGTPLKTIPYKP